MITIISKLCKPFILILVAALFFSSFTSAQSVGTSSTCTPMVLNVALYPYVPNPDQFKDVVSQKWESIEPNVSLNYVDWDCYSDDPASNIDVFVFDAIYLSHFVKQNYLLPFSPGEIQDQSDILSFALDGCKDNNVIYAIPQLICTNLLFYRKDDILLKNVRNMKQLNKILGPSYSTEIPPPDNKGLLIDLSGGTTCACTYLDTLIDVNKRYTDYDVMPDLSNLNKSAINDLKTVISMAGKGQSQYVPDPYDAYIRASWFANGSGRAYIGYTESMMNFKDNIKDIDFNLFSWTDSCNIPVFYSDVVGVSSSITDENKKALAKKLANVIAAPDTIEECIKPAAGSNYPQYLLPVRNSVYSRLQSAYPAYRKLHYLVTSRRDLYIFRLGPDVREWIDDAKKVVLQSLGLAQ